jgi:hypothetical protein
MGENRPAHGTPLHDVHALLPRRHRADPTERLQDGRKILRLENKSDIVWRSSFVF